MGTPGTNAESRRTGSKFGYALATGAGLP